MSAITHGMNPDEVEGLATQLNTIAGELRTICGKLNGQVNQTTWVGPDATTFKTNWWPQHQKHLMQVAADLEGFGTSAKNNASAQRTASQG